MPNNKKTTKKISTSRPVKLSTRARVKKKPNPKNDRLSDFDRFERKHRVAIILILTIAIIVLLISAMFFVGSGRNSVKQSYRHSIEAYIMLDERKVEHSKELASCVYSDRKIQKIIEERKQAEGETPRFSVEYEGAQLDRSERLDFDEALMNEVHRRRGDASAVTDISAYELDRLDLAIDHCYYQIL